LSEDSEISEYDGNKRVEETESPLDEDDDPSIDRLYVPNNDDELAILPSK
jgi:hypothetical protein